VTNVGLIKFIMILVVLYTLYLFLRLAGLFKSDKTGTILKNKVSARVREEKRKKKQEKVIEVFAWLGRHSNIKEGTVKYDIAENSLKRLQIEAFGKILDVYEFKGLTVVLLAVSIMLVLFLETIGLFRVFMPFILGAGLVCFFAYQSIFDVLMDTKDKALANQFSDFYLMVYSAIVSPTGSVLKDVVGTYLTVLEDRIQVTKKNNPELNEMAHFVRTYLAFLTQYGELLATRYLKSRYNTSSLVVNFAALVEQRLMGINNLDRLASFKEELLQRKKQNIKNKSEKILERGEIAVKLVYLILVELALLTAFSNLPFMYDYINK